MFARWNVLNAEALTVQHKIMFVTPRPSRARSLVFCQTTDNQAMADGVLVIQFLLGGPRWAE